VHSSLSRFGLPASGSTKSDEAAIEPCSTSRTTVNCVDAASRRFRAPESREHRPLSRRRHRRCACFGGEHRDLADGLVDIFVGEPEAETQSNCAHFSCSACLIPLPIGEASSLSFGVIRRARTSSCDRGQRILTQSGHRPRQGSPADVAPRREHDPLASIVIGSAPG
jgi:hypothetical protein